MQLTAEERVTITFDCESGDDVLTHVDVCGPPNDLNQLCFKLQRVAIALSKHTKVGCAIRGSRYRVSVYWDVVSKRWLVELGYIPGSCSALETDLRCEPLTGTMNALVLHPNELGQRSTWVVTSSGLKRLKTHLKLSRGVVIAQALIPREFGEWVAPGAIRATWTLHTIKYRVGDEPYLGLSLLVRQPPTAAKHLLPVPTPLFVSRIVARHF